MKTTETYISIRAAVLSTGCGLVTNIVDILWLTGDVMHNGLEVYHVVIGFGLSITPPVLFYSLWLIYRAMKAYEREAIEREKDRVELARIISSLGSLVPVNSLHLNQEAQGKGDTDE